MKPLSNHSVCPSCGGGHKSKPFCVYDNGYHCFACNTGKYADRAFSIRPRLVNNIPEFPEYTSNLSEYKLEALEWLTKYNITEYLIHKHSIHSCVDDGSLLFLNIQGDTIRGYQRRDAVTRLITTQGEKIPMLFESNEDVLVLVEDYISAIRVSKFCDTLCLWGIKIAYDELYAKFKQYDKILVWLDNDTEKPTNSGQKAAAKIIKNAKSIIRSINYRKGFTTNNKQIKNIVSAQDPKYYLDHEIQKFLDVF